MSRLDTTELSRELTEEYDHKVDVTGHLSDLSEKAHNRRIRAMLDKVVKHDIPENETVRELQVIFDPWNRPVVRVWCNASGFEFENNQVIDQTFMVHGGLYRFKVDVRPF